MSVAWAKVLAAEREASPAAEPGELQEWERTRQRNRRAEHGRSDRPGRQKRPPKPVDPAIVERDAKRIGSMLSRGFDEPTIRRKLGLSRNQWDVRMAALLKRNHDRQTIWAKLRAATRANLRMLAMVRRRALDATPPAYNAAIRATQAMQAIMEREVSVGQSLGEYRRVATERAAPGEDQDQRPNLVGIDASEAFEDEFRAVVEDLATRDEPIIVTAEPADALALPRPAGESDDAMD